MTTTINDLVQNNGGYYDRTEKFAGKNYDKHVFIAGRILQSAEMNEIQSAHQAQLKSVADALFKDGDIVRDCRAVVSNQIVTIESGAIYLRGQVRGVPTGSITVRATGTDIIGIWLVADVVTDTDDNDLRDPAAGQRAFNEPGAYRLRLVPQWGKATDAIADAEFFPVYYTDDGELRAKEPPPNLDAVTQAIARYDVDSNGSNYVIEGLRVTRLDDDKDPVTQAARQVFSVGSGRARVNGFGIAQNSARRVPFPVDIPLKGVDQESFGLKLTWNGNVARFDLRYTPLNEVTRLRVQKQTTFTMTRANAGLTDTFQSGQSPQVVLKVYQGATEYKVNDDYTFDPNNGGIMTWVAGGKAPTPGNGYSIDCYHWELVKPENQDDTGFEVTGMVKATAGTNPTTAYVDYTFRLPRIDRLVVDEGGQFAWVKGIASEINPVSPQVPNNVLSICQVYQAWASDASKTFILNDGVRMVSMSTLEGMNNRLDDVTDMIAQLNLVSNVNVQDTSKKHGLYVDPFTNNNIRDMGVNQELAIAGNCLQLPITGEVLTPTPAAGATAITDIISCEYVDEVILSNTARTTSMKVNPYMAFDPPFPGQVTITPQIDRWVDTQTTWVGAETRYFTTTVYAPWTLGNVHGQSLVTGQNTVNELASSTTADAEYLRSIEVHFTVSGFLAKEEVQAFFDSVPVTLNP
ncbi:DUF4815 domain-containing protein [Salmonella enterica]|nr:DUF4815 domain-containing protein [Salmonella enterica]EKK6596268.1 DUF4815 domain-containing protein [Salmonella enterica]